MWSWIKYYVSVKSNPNFVTICLEVIGTKWVLRVKTDARGNLDKFKAKVVVKGFR